MTPTSIHHLPDEIWLSIVSFLMLEDLQRASLSSRRFQRVTRQRLVQHINLKRDFYRINDPFQREPSGWLAPLLGLLKDEFPADYVEELFIAQSEWYYADLPAYDDYEQSQSQQRPSPFSESDMKLVFAAVENSAWITAHDACGPMAAAKDRPDFLREIREGDQDNILAVMLPLLPNLRRLYLPKEIDSDGIPMGSLLGVIDRIASAYGQQVPQAIADLPLQHLEHIECVRAGVYPYFGQDLMQISIFAAIPSVRTIKLGETWETSFEWPDRLPKSRVQVVEFVGGNVEFAAIQGLSRGLACPCTFRHHRRSRFGPNQTTESRWTLAKSDEMGTLKILEKEPRHRLFSVDTDDLIDEP